MGEFRMPSLGADMTEGTLLEWLVKPGQAVHRGDPVAVVDTDKAAIEVEVFEDGVVDRLLIQPGARVAVGAPLAVIAASAPVESAARPAAPRSAAGSSKPAVRSPVVRHLAQAKGVDLAQVAGSGPRGVITRADVEVAARSVPAPVTAPPSHTSVRASPRARRLAAEANIDICTVVGSGADGAVTVTDVERLAAARAPADRLAAATTASARAASMRRAVGELMTRSKREIPHYYLSTTIDMAAATTWLRDQNPRREVAQRLIPAVLLMKAAVRACAVVPEVNGWWVEDHFEPSERVHLGVAVALRPVGLVAPVIASADTLDLDSLMVGLRGLVARARSGSLRASEMSTPTITVTNLGDMGVDAVYGVIYPPQVALVGFGKQTERPWAQDGMLGVRTAVTATLSGDHRVSDGHRGGLYLAALSDLMQRPEEL